MLAFTVRRSFSLGSRNTTLVLRHCPNRSVINVTLHKRQYASAGLRTAEVAPLVGEAPKERFALLCVSHCEVYCKSYLSVIIVFWLPCSQLF
jgi:hypothetical protein